MFDFNTRNVSTGIVAGAAVLSAGAQAANAQTVQQFLPNGVNQSDTSGVPAIYEFTFPNIANASKVTFDVDGSEGDMFALLRGNSADDEATGAASLELQLDGVWQEIGAFNLSISGPGNDFQFITGTMYTGFGPASLSGVRLSVTPTITGGDPRAEATVFGDEGFMLVHVPTPGSIALLGLAGLPILRRRRHGSARL